LTNVSSNQVQKVRVYLRKYKGELVVGKNNVLRKAINERISGPPEGDPRKASWKPMPELEKLLQLVVGKVGLIFTDEPLSELKPAIEENKRGAYAKVGKIAPIDYTIPAGGTSLDPSQINFFHALQIPTKINKSMIEITRDVKICTKGKPVSQSEAAFLQKLGQKPFTYNMEVVNAYDNGSVIGPELMTLTTHKILERFTHHARNLTALSLETGIATEVSVYQSIFNSFKNLAAISVSANYPFKQFSANAAPAHAPAPAAKAEGKADKPAAKKVEEPKKEAPPVEEEAAGLGGLFD